MMEQIEINGTEFKRLSSIPNILIFTDIYGQKYIVVGDTLLRESITAQEAKDALK